MPLLPAAIKGLIPHQPPMLVVDELISCSEGQAVSSTVFDSDSMFVRKSGQVEEAVLFEMMAQTLAAALAYNLSARAASAQEDVCRPQAGFLVALKKINFYASAVIHKPVLVNVSLKGLVEDFYVVDGEAAQAGNILASGQITIYVPMDL